MATVTGYTAEKMQEIVDKTLAGASIIANHLILTLDDGSTIDAGSVVATTPPLVSTVAALAALETFDGREAFFSHANGKWHLRYDQPNDRWDVVGGPPLTARVDADVSTSAASNTYGTMTSGPSIAIPLTMSCEVHVGAEIDLPVSTTSMVGFMNYRKQGAAVPGDDIDSARFHPSGAGNTGGMADVISPPGTKSYTVGDVVEALMRDGSVNFSATFRKRWMRITPRYVST